MKTKILSIILILFVCNNNCFSQEKTSKWQQIKVNTIAKRLAKRNSFDCGYIGIAGKISKQQIDFEKLYKTVTNQQLISLTDHKNSVIQGYAFVGLMFRKIENKLDLDLFPFFFKLLQDKKQKTRKIRFQCGCGVTWGYDSNDVANFIYSDYNYYADKDLTEEQKEIIREMWKWEDEIIENQEEKKSY